MRRCYAVSRALQVLLGCHRNFEGHTFAQRVAAHIFARYPRKPPGCARGLCSGVLQRDMRVQPAARCCDRIYWAGRAIFGGICPLPLRNCSNQRRRGWPKVAGPSRRCVIAAGKGSRAQVRRGCKVLANQIRPDGFSIPQDNSVILHTLNLFGRISAKTENPKIPALTARPRTMSKVINHIRSIARTAKAASANPAKPSER